MRYYLKDASIGEPSATLVREFNSKQAYRNFLVELNSTHTLDWSVGSTFATRHPIRGVYSLVHTKTGEVVEL